VSRRAIWITGASSGIGAALVRSVPDTEARVFGVARRESAACESLALDLAEPAAWGTLDAHFDAVFSSGLEAGMLLHFAGTGGPYGTTARVDLDEYVAAVLLNCAAGLVLGKAFLSAATRTGASATIVLCSSPAAAAPLPGMSSYGSGKAALEYWIGVTAAEGTARVLGVVPYAVDTPMVREVMQQSVADQPLAPVLAQAEREGALASPGAVAAEIWALIIGDAPSGSVVSVGAVPEPNAGIL
jgi:benzil reductase ((S)-benzoin forming)